MSLPPYASPLERAWHVTLWAIAVLVLGFLILPILVIVPLSFNSGSFLSFPMPGLSLRWYHELLGSERCFHRSATAWSSPALRPCWRRCWARWPLSAYSGHG